MTEKIMANSYLKHFILFLQLICCKNIFKSLREKIRILAPLVFLTILIFTNSGCTRQCIDPDDFGFPKFNITAKYRKKDISGEKTQQIAPWIETNIRIDSSSPLIVVAKNWQLFPKEYGYYNNLETLSAWCPWYGDEPNSDDDDYKVEGSILSDLAYRFPTCEIEDNNPCPNNNNSNLPITNPPCLLTKGMGLYMALIRQNPNSNIFSQRNPILDENKETVIHVGSNQTDYSQSNNIAFNTHVSPYGFLDNGGGIYLSTDSTQNYHGNKIYFKILDKYYDDNSGQQIVTIKSGYYSPNLDLFSSVIKYVKDSVLGFHDEHRGLIPSMYKNIVHNPIFIYIAKTFLTLYIIIFCASFIMGLAKLSNFEMAKHVLKIVIISFLISENSWSFFYNTLFVFFIDGSEFLQQMIINAGNNGPGASNIISFMMTPQTIYKVLSLLFADILGWAYIILYCVTLVWLFIVYLKAYVLYITCLLVMGLIIVMAPIFICLSLFSITRNLFDNWIKKMTKYALQPIILFTGITFIAVIIKKEIYTTLGFPVCLKGFPQLNLNDKDTASGAKGGSATLLSWWFPMLSNKNPPKQIIPLPWALEGHQTMDRENKFSECAPYSCIGERYPDLPFFDPVQDRELIEDFRNQNFVHLNSIFLIVACVYFLSQFNETAVSLAQSISTGSIYGLSLSGVASKAAAPLQSIGAIGLKSIGGMGLKAGSGLARRAAIPAQRMASGIGRGSSFLAKKLAHKTLGEERTDNLVNKIGASANKVKESGKKAGRSIGKVYDVISGNKDRKDAKIKLLKKKYGIEYEALDFKAAKAHEDRIYHMLKKHNFSNSKIKYVLGDMGLSKTEKNLGKTVGGLFVDRKRELAKALAQMPKEDLKRALIRIDTIKEPSAFAKAVFGKKALQAQYKETFGHMVGKDLSKKYLAEVKEKELDWQSKLDSKLKQKQENLLAEIFDTKMVSLRNENEINILRKSLTDNATVGNSNLDKYGITIKDKDISKALNEFKKENPVLELNNQKDIGEFTKKFKEKILDQGTDIEKVADNYEKQILAQVQEKLASVPKNSANANNFELMKKELKEVLQDYDGNIVSGFDTNTLDSKGDIVDVDTTRDKVVEFLKGKLKEKIASNLQNEYRKAVSDYVNKSVTEAVDQGLGTSIGDLQDKAHKVATFKRL